MSSVNEPRNNQGPTPGDYDTSRNTNSHPPNTRDPRYYYEDGSTLFVVDGVLFKLQGSLVFGSRSTNHPSGTSSRDHPRGFSLPDITASQFRNFLLVVLGLPSDPEYLAVLTDAQNKTKHNRDLLVRYLDISCITRRFGMSELEGWARSQLCLVLDSVYSLALGEWDKETLLRLDSYARSTGEAKLMSSVTTFIQYFVSISANRQVDGQQPAPSNLNTCVQLYKDPNLSRNNPAVFGSIFASILSLGHRSNVWTSHMSNKDRAVLYAAQVQLTPAAAELKRIGWLQRPTVHSTPSLTKDLCGQCQAQLGAIWGETFGKCGGLNSEVILRDVTSLALLPHYRRLLASKWNASLACSAVASIPPNPYANSGLDRNRSNREGINRASMLLRPEELGFEKFMNTSNTPIGGNKRHSLAIDVRGIRGQDLQVPEKPRVRAPTIAMRGGKCPRLEGPLADIDRRIQQVYEELASRQRGFVSHVYT